MQYALISEYRRTLDMESLYFAAGFVFAAQLAGLIVAGLYLSGLI